MITAQQAKDLSDRFYRDTLIDIEGIINSATSIGKYSCLVELPTYEQYEIENIGSIISLYGYSCLYKDKQISIGWK